MNMLEANAISKCFPGVKALDNVTFSIKQGEMVGLVGENGAGKSTLMKIIAGYYPHSSYEGELKVKGSRVQFSRPLDAEKVGLEMIYQEINMHLDLTVAENIFLGRWPRKASGLVDWRRMTTESLSYLGMVGADFAPDALMRSLSASKQQQVAIARALFRQPLVLILDEPTSVLTEREAAVLFGILHRLNRDKQLTVILISHKLDEVFEHTRRIVTLRDGRTVGSHDVQDVDKACIVGEMVGRQMHSFFFKQDVAIGDTILEVRNLCVAHPYIPRKRLIDDVSFSLRAGEILGIAGLVGAGRSELVNAMFGKDRKISGTIVMDGKPLREGDQRVAIAAGIGLVPEDRKKDGFVPLLDISANMTLASLKRFHKAGFVARTMENRAARQLFDQLQIKAPALSMPVGKLSGGNQQKVVLAKWLLAGSRVLLLDEPTRGVDIGAKEEIYHLIASLVAKGLAIVLISSELVELLALSDRIVVLKNGKITANIDRPDFSGERVMEHAI
jgi:D-xylose transport system ATP-binding protein